MLDGVKLPILKSSTSQQSLPLNDGEHYRAEGWVSLSINPVFFFKLLDANEVGYRNNCLL